MHASYLRRLVVAGHFSRSAGFANIWQIEPVTAVTASDGNTVTKKGAARQSGGRGKSDGSDGMTAFLDFYACARARAIFLYDVSRTLKLIKCRHAVTYVLRILIINSLRCFFNKSHAVTCRHCRHDTNFRWAIAQVKGGTAHV